MDSASLNYLHDLLIPREENLCVHCRASIVHDGDQWVARTVERLSDRVFLGPLDNPYCSGATRRAHSPL